MKKVSQILIVMAIMGLMSCGQLHVVTLYVDTAQIDSGSIDQNAHFGQPAGVSNEEFTTHVRKGDKIIWDAVSISNPKDEVKITSVNHISGDRIFERKLSGSTTTSVTMASGITNALFKGIIKKKPSKSKKYLLEKYDLEFTVDEETFNIDPVIKAYR